MTHKVNRPQFLPRTGPISEWSKAGKNKRMPHHSRHLRRQDQALYDVQWMQSLADQIKSNQGE